MKFSLLIKTGIAGSQAGGCVDFWKVGKLNHNQAVEQSALGPKFRADATVADSYCVFDERQVAFSQSRDEANILV